MRYKIGIDVGGTFTDLVYTGGDGLNHVVKTPTTSENQAKGVLFGLEKLASLENLSIRELLKRTDIIIHGTTVVTNTMLEFKGARTGLITTSGFRDDIELRRGYKERIFNPRYPAPVPIVQRRYRHTVNERIDRDGKVLIPLDDNEVIAVVRKLKEAGIESIGVCLFFGFLNPVHEKRIAEIIRQEHPDALVSLSHEVLPQIREFERVSTTLVNAYTAPRLKKYLESLESELQGLGFEKEFFVMLSSGGIMNADYAAKYPVYSLLSGPAGGVVACSQLIGELLDEPDLITVDMGGTSYDVSLIRGGKPTATSNYWFSRYRVAVPMLDIHTIGTGGGSIAWVDSGGALQVGPRSAGAEPGPVCYGKGGTEPTVTDANLLLGYLNPDYFLGGEIRLEKGLAEKAIQEKVARPLGFDTIQAAYGISRIVNNNMANGIRVVSVQRGYDPRDFVLVAFGGNGAVHAGIQARDLGIRKVIVPRIATAFSARGMLSSNIVINKVRTYMGRSDDYDLDAVNSLFSAMQAEVKQEMPDSGGKDTEFMGSFENRYYVDMHYKGETHEITVPLGSHDGAVRDSDIDGALNAFHSAHETLHTFANPDSPAYFMNLRIETIIHTDKPPVDRLELSDEDPSSALKSRRNVYFEEENGFIEIPIYNGSLVSCGNVLKGPCVIEEPATTIVVYPGQAARLTEFGNYEISIN
ncbi:MAG: hydantoinase/oxoprolinase family protein [Desulfobacterales bacterium]